MFCCFQSLKQKQNWPSCPPAITHRDTLCSSTLGFDLKVFFNTESPEAVCLCPLALGRLPILPWQAQYSFHQGLRVPCFEEAHSWLWLKKSSEGAEWAHTGSPVWAGTSLNHDRVDSTESMETPGGVGSEWAGYLSETSHQLPVWGFGVKKTSEDLPTPTPTPAASGWPCL